MKTALLQNFFHPKKKKKNHEQLFPDEPDEHFSTAENVAILSLVVEFQCNK